MQVIKTFPLDGTKNGDISVSIIENPYGKNSDSIVSIAISLNSKSENPDWKVHIPKANIDDVVAALVEAKKKL